MKFDSSLYQILAVRIKFEACPVCQDQNLLYRTFDSGEDTLMCQSCRLGVIVKSKTHEVLFVVSGKEMTEEEFERWLKLKSFQ